MASIVKQKIRDTVGASDSESETELRNKYLLSVTAGPSYDTETHQPVKVNSDESCQFSNEFCTASVRVRIRNYHGLPQGSPSSSPYFESKLHSKDQYSIAFSFVPKKDLNAKDLVWGNDFDHPVRDRLPPESLLNTAFKIVKTGIDPGLSWDAYSDTPWLYGPALSSWFKFQVGGEANNEAPLPVSEELQEGGEGTGQDLRSESSLPDDSEKRRKFFREEKNREKFVFQKGRVYQGDFFNPYLDFSKYALNLPGLSLGVLKYIDDKSHSLRYVFKDLVKGEVYFVVQLKLLFGEEMQQASRERDS